MIPGGPTGKRAEWSFPVSAREVLAAARARIAELTTTVGAIAAELDQKHAEAETAGFDLELPGDVERAKQMGHSDDLRLIDQLNRDREVVNQKLSSMRRWVAALELHPGQLDRDLVLAIDDLIYFGVI